MFYIVSGVGFLMGIINIVLMRKLWKANEIIFEKETELCLLHGRELARQKRETP